MRKSGFYYLGGVILIGLLVAIVAYFVSSGFHAWVEVWLANPAGLAATATTLAAIATFFAVFVGLWGIQVGRKLAHQAYLQAEAVRLEGQRQFLEMQYNASRPLLVPSTTDLSAQYVETEPLTFEWESDTTFVTIQNVGTGLATNIWVTLLPPMPELERNHQYVTQLGAPVPVQTEAFKIYLHRDVSSFEETDKIGEHTLYVPTERATRTTDRSVSYLARMTITYQDIFGRTHASIFDLSDHGAWTNVAFLAGIEQDLGKIDGSKQMVVNTSAVEVG